MNPVLILAHNCLDLTKRCVDSVLAQDIPVTTVVYDNGSSDGTSEYLTDMLGKVGSVSYPENIGVSRGWNEGLEMFFEDYEHVLVLNNDTAILPFFYSKLLSYNLLFVTGISVDEPTDHPDCWHQPAESPDFSSFLIRREAWEKVGPFDERMKFYAQDCDWHVRAHRAGLKLMNAGVPFHHERSSTIRRSSPEDQKAIHAQTELDRAVFKEKHGCFPWEPAYADLFR